MGKKKMQRIKELAVAIGESSSIGDDERGQPQNQSQPQVIRKRGRPRKIVEKTDSGDQPADGVVVDYGGDDDAEEGLEKKALGKNKSIEELEGRDDFTKEDGVLSSQVGGELFRSRKARRKSKPRKSS